MMSEQTPEERRVVLVCECLFRSSCSLLFSSRFRKKCTFVL